MRRSILSTLIPINIRLKNIGGFIGLAASLLTQNVLAQSNIATQNNDDMLEEVIVTGTRITIPGTVSSSPIQSISNEEIKYHQEPGLEKILRSLPATIPGDGANVNNGSDGVATVDLRGLGPQRTLVLMNSKRMVPFNYRGSVDLSTIPTALIDRVDVVTGGASAVYGSDAIAGAINVILKKDFEGVELETNYSKTGENDGEIENFTITLGTNLVDDRGNIAFSLNKSKRDAVLLGQRPLGRLGIVTEDGGNYDAFLKNKPPAAPVAGCGGPDIAASGGSTTAIPTRFSIVGGSTGTSQFRNDRTLSDTCSVFNFNPWNYYQTPFDRYSATAFGHFDITDHVQVYSTFNFTNTTVITQVAPSGTFAQAFDLPIANSFLSSQARQHIIDAGNANIKSGNLVNGSNWQDTNNNGVVDIEDYLKVQLRRRTVELGARSENFDSDQWQFVTGVRGDLINNWKYELSWQYGESNRTTVRAGYTNLTNIQNALDSVDGVTCKNGDPTCVPIDLFGGYGTITPEMAQYATAIALQHQKYEQSIFSSYISGPVNFIESPLANEPLAMSIGYENREEVASLEPDECLRKAPSSCQGGAGGNILPVSGSYQVEEYFVEGILPLIDDKPFVRSLALEVGYRWSDYDITGSNETWKAGLNWRPVDELLVRVMQQQATRAPNVFELFSPVTTGLDNAKFDPCSVKNTANIDDALRALCISTGMTDAQVGAVQDIISGQVNVFSGTDPLNKPKPEIADTYTAGFVWTPDFNLVENFSLSVDYYDINVEGIIDNFSAQEILNQCYFYGVAASCGKINRFLGDLNISGAGIDLFTTNLDYKRAEGVEVVFSFGINLEQWGDLQFSSSINKYLTQESQSDKLSPVIDCKGLYGTSCDPISELRWVQRTTWTLNDLSVSAQWRHIDGVDVEPIEANDVFPKFQSIDAYDYLDLFVSYDFPDRATISLGVDNVLDNDPPVVGNEAGDTSSNSGNTFPSNYDTLGRIYKVSLRLKF